MARTAWGKKKTKNTSVANQVSCVVCLHMPVAQLLGRRPPASYCLAWITFSGMWSCCLGMNWSGLVPTYPDDFVLGFPLVIFLGQLRQPLDGLRRVTLHGPLGMHGLCSQGWEMHLQHSRSLPQVSGPEHFCPCPGVSAYVFLLPRSPVGCGHGA